MKNIYAVLFVFYCDSWIVNQDANSLNLLYCFSKTTRISLSIWILMRYFLEFRTIKVETKQTELSNCVFFSREFYKMLHGDEFSVP